MGLVRRIRPIADAVRAVEDGALQKIAGRPAVHFIHIGKTGGTAMKSALGPWRRSCACNLRLHRHYYRFQHVPRGQRAFFVLRDPIRRFASGFMSRRRMGHVYPWTPVERQAFARFETPEDLASALRSRDRAERAAAERAMRGIGHVKDSYRGYLGDPDELEARSEDILFIGMQESLDSDFPIIKDLIGAPEAAALPTDPVRSHRARRRPELSEASRAALREWYADDYVILEHAKEIRARRGWDAPSPAWV